jgi:hypothetical protein
MGEWGKDNASATKTRPGIGASNFMCDKKLDLLTAEGVAFDKKGILKSRAYLWDGKA